MEVDIATNVSGIKFARYQRRLLFINREGTAYNFIADADKGQTERPKEIDWVILFMFLNLI